MAPLCFEFLADYRVTPLSEQMLGILQTPQHGIWALLRKDYNFSKATQHIGGSTGINPPAPAVLTFKGQSAQGPCNSGPQRLGPLEMCQTLSSASEEELSLDGMFCRSSQALYKPLLQVGVSFGGHGVWLQSAGCVHCFMFTEERSRLQANAVGRSAQCVLKVRG